MNERPPGRWAWIPHAFSLELRKLLSYRVDFWLNLMGAVVAETTIAYFLWRAMFQARGVDQMGGYSFRGMMLYYILVPLTARMIRGEDGRFLSEDIYEGGLTRYLVYPISFLRYKYVSLLTYTFVAGIQILVILTGFAAFFGVPPELHVSGLSVLQGMTVSVAATVLYFFLGASVELIAFWQDSVWSLMGMLRMAMMLAGGGMIPLALFPAWARPALEFSPFACVISIPIRCFLGQLAPGEWLRSLALIALWSVVFWAISSRIWRAGTRQYSGVGL